LSGQNQEEELMEQVEVGIEVKRDHHRTPPTVFIPQPQSVEETGLHSGLLLDLCIKCIYFAGRPVARQISAHIMLPFPVVEELLDFLKREQYVEVVGSSGAGESQYKYALTVKGMEKADEVMRRCQYNGPAPVAFEQYVEVQHQQSVRGLRIDSEIEKKELAHLVLDETTVFALGAAVNSGRSMLLYGNSGNGKSSAAGAIGRMLPGQVLIPYAFEYNGHVIKVFDPRVHVEIPDDTEPDQRSDGTLESLPDERRRDRRWVRTLRPVVMAGGSLSLQEHHFERIFRQVCESKEIACPDEALRYLMEKHYIAKNRPLRGCHPRDIVELIESIASYRGERPELRPELIDIACSFYFVDL
jgi:hypothetical protein